MATTSTGKIVSAAAVAQLFLMGSCYAFPLWLLNFKRVFTASQTQANTIGIVLYLSVSCLGIPLSPFVLSRLRPWATALLVTTSTLLGFLLLYLCAEGRLGSDKGGFVVVLLSIFLTMVPLGIWFSFAATRMMQWLGALLVSGILSVGLSSGGAFAGVLFAYTGLSLASNLLVLVIAQGVLAPVVVACVYLDERASAGKAQAPVGSVNDDEGEPLLKPSAPAKPAAAAAETGANMALGPFMRRMLTSPDYYFVLAVIILKVGIGGSFMTNLGTAVQASMPGNATSDQIDNKVAVSVIIANFGQLAGRLSVTLFSLVPLRRNPNLNTLVTLVIVSLMYMASFATLWAVPLTVDHVLILTGVFGVAYGGMWCTTSALIPYCPLTEPVPRMLALTMPFGGIGTLTLNLLSGALYDRHAVDTPEGKRCSGHDCYSDTILIWLGMTTVLLLLVTIRICFRIPGS